MRILAAVRIANSVTQTDQEGRPSMSAPEKHSCIYPGTFDPLTNGHLDLISRALHIFDTVIVAIAVNPDKNPIFTVEERLEMIRDAVDNNPRVVTDSFEGLLVEYARSRGVYTVLRGMRAMSDFEYEYEMTFMNRKLDRDIDTIFMMTGLRWLFVHSKTIKAAVKAGADVSGMVPELVARKLYEKLR
jgi:pantetheine-phosphate adenylyltransferase